MVVKDGKGEVLATLVAPKDYIVELDVAEVTTALRVIKLSKELGFHKMVLEGDADSK